MAFGFELFVLIQIYDFIDEKFIAQDKPSSQKVIEFFESLSLDGAEKETFIHENKMYGNFGRLQFIDLMEVPFWGNKDEFIKWAYKKLNS